MNIPSSRQTTEAGLMRGSVFCLVTAGLFFHPGIYASACDVTVPKMSDPIGSLASTNTRFGWHGSNELAALIPGDGNWTGMGSGKNYRDKFWWWRLGFNARSDEAQPDLTIHAHRIDGDAPMVFINNATSGYGESWDAMLVMMEFPTSGCWRVIGSYKGRELHMTLNVGKELVGKELVGKEQ